MKWKMELQFQCNVFMFFIVKLAQNKRGWGVIPNSYDGLGNNVSDALPSSLVDSK
jgi:hypothetical protein